MFKSFVYFLFFILFPVITLAQGRIGNGGGLGEMRALTAFENMPNYIESSLLNKNLNESDLEKLRLVQKNHSIEKKIGGIDFYVSTEEGYSSILTEPFVGARIRVNSNLLADSEGKPYELKVIARYVLYGLLLHHTDHIQSYKISSIVFEELHENSVEIGFNYYFNFYFIHKFQIFDRLDANTPREEVYFEFSSKTQLLNTFLIRDLNCNEGIAWNVQKMYWLKENQVFMFELEWSCKSKKNGYAKVILNFLPNQKNIIDEESLNFKTIGIVSPR